MLVSIKKITGRLLPVSVLVMSLAGTIASEPTADDRLWQKAVAVADRNHHWVARSFSEQRRVFDADGDLRSSSDSRFVVSGPSRSALKVRVIASQKDGADNLAERQRELEKNQARQNNSGQQRAEHPFASENQSRVSYRALPASRDLEQNGRRYRAFAYTQRTERGTWDGVAYIDTQSGMPLRLVSQARVASLPPSEDKKARLRSLQVRVDYNTSSAQTWRAKAVHLQLELSYQLASLLSFDGRVKNIYHFQQYEIVPAP